MSAESTPRIVVRHAARVVLIDDLDRLLLFLFRFTPADGVLRELWITPGGGLDPDETHEAAATRELWEETGISVSLGPCVWTRSFTGPWDDHFIEQHERYFVARTPARGIETTNQTQFERVLMPEHRWWSIDEIRASSDVFAPGALAEALVPLIAGEYPPEPIDVGA
jgi:8-oxo-dGTP pyrophosphatase MutT (NUDIX family)